MRQQLRGVFENRRSPCDLDSHWPVVAPNCLHGAQDLQNSLYVTPNRAGCSLDKELRYLGDTYHVIYVSQVLFW